MKLKTLRTHKHYSLKQLSKLSQVSDGYLSELENGRKQNPKYQTLEKIATALGVSVAELVGKEECNETQAQEVLPERTRNIQAS